MRAHAHSERERHECKTQNERKRHVRSHWLRQRPACPRLPRRWAGDPLFGTHARHPTDRPTQRRRPRPIFYRGGGLAIPFVGPMHGTPPTGPAPRPRRSPGRTPLKKKTTTNERKRQVSDQEPFLTQTQRCPCTGCVEKRGLPTRRQSQEQVQSIPRPPQTPWAAV